MIPLFLLPRVIVVIIENCDYFFCPVCCYSVIKYIVLYKSLFTMALCGGAYCGSGSIFFVAFFLCWYGIASVMVYFGIDIIIEGTEYSKNSSKEECLLIDYYESECSYDCHCDSDGESCSTCYGIEYDYIAISETKCGNQTLDSHEYDSKCPGALKTIGREYECYVLPCEESEFTFNDPEGTIGWGIALCVFAGIFLFVPCCIARCMFSDGFCDDPFFWR